MEKSAQAVRRVYPQMLRQGQDPKTRTESAPKKEPSLPPNYRINPSILQIIGMLTTLEQIEKEYVALD